MLFSNLTKKLKISNLFVSLRWVKQEKQLMPFNEWLFVSMKFKTRIYDMSLELTFVFSLTSAPLQNIELWQ